MDRDPNKNSLDEIDISENTADERYELILNKLI